MLIGHKTENVSSWYGNKPFISFSEVANITVHRRQIEFACKRRSTIRRYQSMRPGLSDYIFTPYRMDRSIGVNWPWFVHVPALCVIFTMTVSGTVADDSSKRFRRVQGPRNWIQSAVSPIWWTIYQPEDSFVGVFNVTETIHFRNYLDTNSGPRTLVWTQFWRLLLLPHITHGNKLGNFFD